MRIIKVCVTCIGAIVFESILCLSRVLSHIVQRVAALFSLLFLLSAVIALIQDRAITYMVGASMLGFFLCILIPFVFQLMIAGVELLEEKFLI